MISYKDAGVDIDAGNDFVNAIKPFVKATQTPHVLGGIGSFSGAVRLPAGYKKPAILGATDGVGTKLRLAIDARKFDGVGQDLVAMCVNDLICNFAEPLFFLDYYATAKLEIADAKEVVKSIAEGCKLARCALIGGETAEMPSMYPDGEYDLAGFAVGVVEKSQVINGRNIVAGDVVLGLASNGAHSNGYSLVRKILARDKPELDTPFDGEKTLRQAIIAPTRLYVKPVLAALKEFEIKGMAHITGGGITENVPRVLPENCVAQIDANAWRLPKLFQWLQHAGNVEMQEMYRTFNCGIGMVVIVSPEVAEQAEKLFVKQGETVYRLGKIRERVGDEHQTQIK